MNRPAATHSLILFDGACNLCVGAVAWIVARDRRERFAFAALDSQAARDAIAAAGEMGPVADSIVLIDERGVHTRSDAVLRIASGLGFPYVLAGGLRIVPRPVRDTIYAWIARNRRRWFGSRESCPVPPPETRDRFLDADEAGTASPPARTDRSG